MWFRKELSSLAEVSLYYYYYYYYYHYYHHHHYHHSFASLNLCTWYSLCKLLDSAVTFVEAGEGKCGWQFSANDKTADLLIGEITVGSLDIPWQLGNRAGRPPGCTLRGVKVAGNLFLFLVTSCCSNINTYVCISVTMRRLWVTIDTEEKQLVLHILSAYL